MTDHEQIRGTLLEMLEDLDDRLTKITDDVKHADEPLAKDFAEQATQTENDEVLDHLGNATRSKIEQVKQALARIDSGNYGLCEVCGDPIDKKRLEVLPHACMCIKCASQSGC